MHEGQLFIMLCCNQPKNLSIKKESSRKPPNSSLKLPLVLINIMYIPSNSQVQWFCIHKHAWNCIFYKKKKT